MPIKWDDEEQPSAVQSSIKWEDENVEPTQMPLPAPGPGERPPYPTSVPPESRMDFDPVPRADSVLLSGLNWTGRQLDRVSGAPTRAFAGSIMQDPQRPDAAIKAGYEAFKEPESAPSFGMVSDVLLDWQNFFPGTAAIKALGKTAKVGKIFPKAAKGAAIAGEWTLTGKAPNSKALFSTIDETVESSKRANEMILSPKPRADYKELDQIGRELGLTSDDYPAALKFGDDSEQAVREINEAKIPSNRNIRDKWTKNSDAVVRGLRDDIQAIAGGDVPDAIEAGEILMDSYNRGFDKAMQGLEMTHSKVVKQMPGLPLDVGSFGKLEDVAEKAKRWALDNRQFGGAAQKESANRVLEVIDRIEKSPKNYQAMNAARASLGDEIWGVIDPMGKKVVKGDKYLKDIYFGLNDALTGSLRKVDPKAADQLVETNKVASRLLDAKKNADKFLKADMAPEKALARLLGNSRAAKDALTFVDPNDLQRVKGSFLQEQIYKTTPDGEFNPMSFYKKLNNSNANKTALSVLFEADELKPLMNKFRFADAMGPKFTPGSSPITADDLASSFAKGEISLGALAGKGAGFLGDVKRTKGLQKAEKELAIDPKTKNLVLREIAKTPLKRTPLDWGQFGLSKIQQAKRSGKETQKEEER